MYDIAQSEATPKIEEREAILPAQRVREAATRRETGRKTGRRAAADKTAKLFWFRSVWYGAPPQAASRKRGNAQSAFAP